MNETAHRIEELKSAAASRDIDLSGFHIFEAGEWIIQAAQALGLNPTLALAVGLPFEEVVRLS